MFLTENSEGRERPEEKLLFNEMRLRPEFSVFDEIWEKGAVYMKKLQMRQVTRVFRVESPQPNLESSAGGSKSIQNTKKKPKKGGKSEKGQKPNTEEQSLKELEEELELFNAQPEMETKEKSKIENALNVFRIINKKVTCEVPPLQMRSMIICSIEELQKNEKLASFLL